MAGDRTTKTIEPATYPVASSGDRKGPELPADFLDHVEVEVRVRAPAPIDRVEVCRNNRFIYTNRPDGTEAELTFVDREPLQGRSYYYVRVVQKDEEIAWSSPVWFGAKQREVRDAPSPRSIVASNEIRSKNEVVIKKHCCNADCCSRRDCEWGHPLSSLSERKTQIRAGAESGSQSG